MNKHNSGDLLTTIQDADTYAKIRNAIRIAEDHGTTIEDALYHMGVGVEDTIRENEAEFKLMSNGLTRLENMRIVDVLTMSEGMGSEYMLRIKQPDFKHKQLPSAHYTSEETFCYDNKPYVEVKTYLVYTLEGAAEIQRNIDALPGRIEEWRESLKNREIISTFDEVQELHKAMFGTTAELNSFFGLGL